MAYKSSAIGGGKRGNVNKRGYGEFCVHNQYGGGILIESLEELVLMTPVPEMILILNDLKAQYNAHCADTTPHTVADATNLVTAADATDEATAYTLANALKTAYEAHRVLTTDSVHDAADSTNTITSDDATTTATLCTLTEELKTDYEAHRVNTSSCHDASDTTNAVTAADYGAKTCSIAKVPAGAFVLGVNTYVKEGMATAVNYDVGISGDATRFVSNNLDTVNTAFKHIGDAWDRYTSETALILTPNARPTTTAGKIYVQVIYMRLQALTGAPSS